MTKITREQLHRWADQEQAAALAWHSANMGARLTPDLRDAFARGFADGYRKAIAAIIVHGGTVETTKDELRRRA